MGRKRAEKKSELTQTPPKPAEQQQPKKPVGRPRKYVEPVKEKEAASTSCGTAKIVLEQLDLSSYRSADAEKEPESPSPQKSTVKENPKSPEKHSNVTQKALAQLADLSTTRVTRRTRRSLKNEDTDISKTDPDTPTPTTSNVEEEESQDTEMVEIIETKEERSVETSKSNSPQLQEPISVDPAQETTPILLEDSNSQESVVYVIEPDTSEKTEDSQEPLEADIKPLQLESIVSEEKLDDIKEKLASIDLKEDIKPEKMEVEEFKEELSESMESKSQDIKGDSGDSKDSDIKQEEISFEDSVSNVRRSRRLKSIVDNRSVPVPDLSLLRNLPPTPQQTPSESPTNSQYSSPVPRKSDLQEFLPHFVSTSSSESQMIYDPMNPVQPIIPANDRLAIDAESIEKLSKFITIRDNIYLSQRIICKINKTMKCDCTISEEEIRGGELGCRSNCINRLLYIECSSKCRLGIYCDNQQFQLYRYSRCSVFRTEKKGFGIQADQEIFPDQFIFEYVGEVLNNKQFEKRAKLYSKEKNKHYYFMALRSNAIIDATTKGNISRFINHSCDPNAMTQKWTVNGELRVGFFSTRYIKPGEEITFDYQFQRYGKEAQKCYCEADNCRGWIGEQPISDEEEEEEIEEEEADAEEDVADIDEEQVEEKQIEEKTVEKVKKKRKTKVKKSKSIIEDDEDKESEDEANDADYENEEEEAEPSTEHKEPLPKKETRKYVRKIKKHQKIYEDLEIEGEINELLRTGLKNRAQTVGLSRLVVRAKNLEARLNLLDILKNGDKACRQLFLDYNGLKLFYNYWMCEINIKNSIEEIKFCIKLIEVLDILEIKNKTIVRDSKVMLMMEKWKNLDLEEKKKLTKEEKKKQKQDEKLKRKREKELQAGKITESSENVDIPELLKQDSSIGSNLSVANLKDILDKTVDSSNSADPQNVSMDEITTLKLIVKEKATELYKKWDVLVEDFKIPKKQKLEEMKLHEKEADLHYQATEKDLDRKDGTDRFKSRKEIKPNDSSKNYYKKQVTSAPIPANDHLSKQQKRQLYEIEMAQKDAEKKWSEMYQLHEQNCAIFGLNPQSIPFSDVPVYMNPVTGQYFTCDHRLVPTPPNHASFQIKAPALSTNPDHYILPKIDLPEHWKFSIDEKGRIFYYHVKIREAQWEPPIKIMPLVEDDDDDEPFTDESTTDTVDSEEEELIETLKMLQKKRANKDFVKSSVNTSGIGHIVEHTEEDDLEQKIMNNMLTNPAEQTSLGIPATPVNSSPMINKKKKKSRRGLVQTKFIKPRTEQDKLYGMQEMKRYKEIKEKLRREKKRRAMKNLPPASLDEEEDEESVSGEVNLNDSTVDVDDSLINNKFITSSIDELDMWKNQSARRIEKIRKMKKPEAASQSKVVVEKRRSSDFLQKKRKSETLVQPGPAIDLKEMKKMFRDEIKAEIANYLLPYCEETCVSGRITCDDHYHHLINKLTYSVFMKESKHCENTSNILKASDSVKSKTREYIKKYMGKFGVIYEKKDDELDYSNALSKL